MREIAVQVLLFFGVAVCLLSSLGILAMRGMYDKLHYLAPIGTVGAVSLVAALWLDGTSASAALKEAATLILLSLSSAVLTQATARAKEARDKRLKD